MMDVRTIYFYVALAIIAVTHCTGEEQCGCPAFDPVYDIVNHNSPNVALDKEVFFYLYVRHHDYPCKLRIGDIERLKRSPFNSENPTKLIVHGYGGFGFENGLQQFRKNYLKTGKYNVIIVDWGRAAKRTYEAARNATRQVGKYMAQLVEFLEREGGLSLDDLHIIGHSLGGHIAGYAGQGLDGRAGRVTGLDPAGLGFEKPQVGPEDRLDPTDGQFVDVIHSDAGVAGYVASIGHADFRPNGGKKPQPGCPEGSILSCNHIQAMVYFAHSILRPKAYPSVKCESLQAFEQNRCTEQSAFMGNGVSKDARGDYYTRTN